MKALGIIWSIAILLFLMLPIFVIVLVSVSPSPQFQLPSGALTLRWYRELAGDSSLISAFWISMQIAVIATAVSVILSLCACVAIVLRPGTIGESVSLFLTSPLMVPGIVIGIALAQAFRMAGLYDAYPSLVIAHVVVTLPFAMRSILSALKMFDFALLDAAQTLGCSFGRAIWKVLVPNVSPAIITAATFSFLTSFDNYSVSIFLTDVATRTLPIQILKYIEIGPTPNVAALSVVLLIITLIGLIIVDRRSDLGRV